MRSTESAIISSYPTSVSGIIVLLNTKYRIKISQLYFLQTQVFCCFVEKFSVIKMLVPIFLTNYSIQVLYYRTQLRASTSASLV